MPRNQKLNKWEKLLGEEAREKGKIIERYPEYLCLDHKDQAFIHNDCQELSKVMPLFQESDLQNTLELLITFHCKAHSMSYFSGLHQVIAPFFLMHFTTIRTSYGAFSVFLERMMPRMFHKNLHSFQVFQKLLMYHDPILSSTLQGTFPNHQSIIENWINTCLASCLEISQLLNLWEYCLRENNPSFTVFFAVASLMKHRDKLMAKKRKPKLEIPDLEEFYLVMQEAKNLQQETPRCFVKLIKKLLNKPQHPSPYEESIIENSVVLPVSEKEVVQPKNTTFVIDLRKSHKFKKGHYPEAFNIPYDLELSTGKF